MDSTVTREYMQTPAVQRRWDLLFRRQQRVQVLAGVQTGRGLFDVMRSVAVWRYRADGSTGGVRDDRVSRHWSQIPDPSGGGYSAARCAAVVSFLAGVF